MREYTVETSYIYTQNVGRKKERKIKFDAHHWYRFYLFAFSLASDLS